MRIRSRVAVLLAISLALCGASAAAARSQRPLTHAEYRQLQLAQKRIRSLESSDARGVARADRVCEQMQGVSSLIAAVRSGCIDLIRLGADNAKLNARATKCGIDPGSEAAILSCLVPAVESYYQDAEAFYLAESHVNRLATARGFSAGCVAVIGDSPGNIAAEGRLAAALRAAVQALKQQDPQALQTLSGQLHAAASAIRPGPSSLSLCPHR